MQRIVSVLIEIGVLEKREGKIKRAAEHRGPAQQSTIRAKEVDTDD